MNKKTLFLLLLILLGFVAFAGHYALYTFSYLTTDERVKYQEEKFNVNRDDKVVNQYKGKIVLQVEENGEAWYIAPFDGSRYFLGNPQQTIERAILFAGQSILDLDEPGFFLDETSPLVLYRSDSGEVFTLSNEQDVVNLLSQVAIGLDNGQLRQIPFAEIK